PPKPAPTISAWPGCTAQPADGTIYARGRCAQATNPQMPACAAYNASGGKSVDTTSVWSKAKCRHLSARRSSHVTVVDGTSTLADGSLWALTLGPAASSPRLGN